MIIRRYEHSDLETLQDWYRQHKLPNLTEAMLSSNGLIVEDEQGPLCAGFVYSTDSATAMIEGVSKNPEAPRELTDEALEVLIGELTILARELGFSYLFAYSNKRSAINRFEKTGFSRVYENTVTVNRRL